MNLSQDLSKSKQLGVVGDGDRCKMARDVYVLAQRLIKAGSARTSSNDSVGYVEQDFNST